MVLARQSPGEGIPSRKIGVIVHGCDRLFALLRSG
jgi:hypothetical protein